MIRIQYTLLSLFLLMYSSLLAQNDWLKAPARSEGEGPFSQLIIRGVTLINGTGSPPIGPVDVVVEKNRITEIAIVGAPGVEIKTSRRPKAKPGAKIVEADGMYLLPGFVDMHGHMGGRGKGATPEYIFKLWMGHGQTTIRDPGTAVGLEWGLEHKRKSNKNEITAPRILAYSTFGRGSDSPISTPEGAREWVRENAKKGSDGIKFFGVRPDIMEAALDENKKMGLRSACHHAQMNVAWQNALQSARMGLTTMEHWYGLPEAMFEDKTVQDYPVDYNYQNEEHRFGEAGRLWKQAAKPGSPVWNAVIDEMLELDFNTRPNVCGI